MESTAMFGAVITPPSITLSDMWVRLHYDTVNQAIYLDNKQYHIKKSTLNGAYAVLRVGEWELAQRGSFIVSCGHVSE